MASSSSSKSLVLCSPIVTPAAKRRHEDETTPTPGNTCQTPKKLSLPEVEDLMEEDVLVPAAEQGGRVNVYVVGSPPEEILVEEDVLIWGRMLNSLVTFGGRVDLLDVVVINAALAQKTDAFPVERAALGMFKGGLPVKRLDFSGGIEAMIYYRSKSGTKKGGTLAARKELAQRMVEKCSFLWSLPIAAAWPPPIVCGPEEGASYLWYFKLDEARSKEGQLKSLVTALTSGGLCSGYSLLPVGT
jgi:hypothetical protein